MAEKMSMDLFLRTLLGSKEFANLAHKDWYLISTLIPGTSPSSCEARFHEMKQDMKVAADIKLIECYDMAASKAESVLYKNRLLEQNSSEMAFESAHGQKSQRKVCFLEL